MHLGYVYNYITKGNECNVSEYKFGLHGYQIIPSEYKLCACISLWEINATLLNVRWTAGQCMGI